MSSGYQILCANKNQSGTIIRLGGSGWSLSQHQAIHKLLSNQIILSINIGDETFTIGVRGEGNDAYLVLEPDATPLDEVDGLMSC